MQLEYTSLENAASVLLQGVFFFFCEYTKQKADMSAGHQAVNTSSNTPSTCSLCLPPFCALRQTLCGSKMRVQ